MNEPEAIERLAALLDGEHGAESAPDSLGALLTLASAVREHSELVAPSSDFRLALRAELLAAGSPVAAPTLAERARTAWQTHTTRARSSARIAVATMTASSMIGTAGVAVAAQAALPGDALYSMKGWTEQARLLLVTSDLAEARLHLAFAAERLAELEAGTDTLTADQIVELLRRMDESSRRGADALLDGVASGTIDIAELKAFTDAQRDGLSRMLQDLPALARPSAEESLALLASYDMAAVGILPATSATDITPGVVTPGRSLLNPTSTDDGRVSAQSIPVPPFGSSTSADALCASCGELPLPLRPAEKGDTSDAKQDDSTDDESAEEPFKAPTNTFTGPSVDEEDEDDDGTTGVADGVSTLPLDDAADAVNSTTGAGVDAGAPKRAAEATDDAIGTVTP